MKYVLLFDLWGGISDADKANPNINTLKTLIENVAGIAIALVGSIAVLFLIVGGFQYISSAGNPDNVFKAKKTILYSIIGLILSIMSYAIVGFIIARY